MATTARLVLSDPITLTADVPSTLWHATAHKEAGAVRLPCGTRVRLVINTALNPNNLPANLRLPKPTLRERLQVRDGDDYVYLVTGQALVDAGVPEPMVQGALQGWPVPLPAQPRATRAVEGW